MDPRRPAQHPFSRPQTHRTNSDVRFAPIPPPPYSSQPPAPRPESLHGNDPFFRRRNERESQPIISSAGTHPQSYVAPNAAPYNSSTLPRFSAMAVKDNSGQRGSQEVTLSSSQERDGRHSSRTLEGMHFWTLSLQRLAFSFLSLSCVGEKTEVVRQRQVSRKRRAFNSTLLPILITSGYRSDDTFAWR